MTYFAWRTQGVALGFKLVHAVGMLKYLNLHLLLNEANSFAPITRNRIVRIEQKEWYLARCRIPCFTFWANGPI